MTDNPLYANDIVALDCPHNQKSWSNHAYLSKAFHRREITHTQRILCNYEAYAFLWSAKEAAYKLLMKQGRRNRFNPRDFTVSEVSPISEKGDYAFSIQCGRSKLKGFCRISDNIAHAICGTHQIGPSTPYSFTFKTGNIEKTHEAGHQLMLEVARIITSEKHLEINKTTQGIPFLTSNGSPLATDISLSHDANYVGITIAYQRPKMN
ncbi:MAG: 4'-phosphopantetheinyl transferase superfamily protein [Bacteroidetes bacterium]|nr:4'-phosphopantetheinyl transferase superfamily protein [Bacteroidota bacterium]MBU1719576.1 4'-phosphopantetheinyl transferase superfamily protein [Bacteroidota bacterium]